MHLQRTINTKSCKSGAGASRNEFVFAALSKRRIFGGYATDKWYKYFYCSTELQRQLF